MAGQRFEFPTTGIAVEKQAVLLAIDDGLLPLKKNLCYYLSRPTVRLEAVLTPQRDTPSAPDYIATHFYGTVLRDEGRYRLWHYGVGSGDEPGTLREGPICYSGVESGTLTATQGFDCAVQWPRGSLADVGGRPVRLRFHLNKSGDATPRLFAVYLTAA